MLTPLSADIFGVGLYDGVDVTPTPNPSSAMYTSAILGGGLFGNNVGLNFQPGDNTAHLVTNPAVMPAGLTGGTLDLSADGAESYASGDLATGASHILANSVGSPFISQIGPFVQLEDGLTFHVAGGGTANITFGLALDGTQDATSPLYGYNQTISLGLGGAAFVYNALEATSAQGFTDTNMQINANYGWVGGAGSVSNETLTSILFSGGFQVSDNQDYQLFFTQGMTCSNGADCDFKNTAQLSLVLPAGVSYTSDSGVFLTETSSNVPEPSTVLLVLTVLVVAGLRFNLRRTRRV